MKNILILPAAVAALLVAVVVPVYAHSGFRGSIWIGPAWGAWGPRYYYPYPYYYEPPVVIEQPPPVYEYEQQAPQAPRIQEPPYYWYFCPEAKAYYPYVKQCPGGWKKVIPTPPDKGKE